MYFDSKFQARSPVVDEFSIYERKLNDEEIQGHYRFCVLPQDKTGWDASSSHKGGHKIIKRIHDNDCVIGLDDGSVKGYPTMSTTGIKMFEVAVDITRPTGEDAYRLTGEGMGVGVSDGNANESGLMYTNESRTYPCLENHIMLWASSPSGGDDDYDERGGEYSEYAPSPLCYLSVAMYGDYEQIPIAGKFSKVILDNFEKGLIYTVVVDYNINVIMFYVNGTIVTVYDFSKYITTPNFRPTYSSDIVFEREQS